MFISGSSVAVVLANQRRAQLKAAETQQELPGCLASMVIYEPSEFCQTS